MHFFKLIFVKSWLSLDFCTKLENTNVIREKRQFFAGWQFVCWCDRWCVCIGYHEAERFVCHASSLAIPFKTAVSVSSLLWRSELEFNSHRRRRLSHVCPVAARVGACEQGPAPAHHCWGLSVVRSSRWANAEPVSPADSASATPLEISFSTEKQDQGAGNCCPQWIPLSKACGCQS